MYKIGICGHFGCGENFYDGQTIKTKTLQSALENKFGKSDIFIVDTYNWKKNPIKLFILCIKLMINCENIIFMPSVNGVKVFVPLFSILKKVFNKNLYYFVIGSRLDKAVIENKYLVKHLKNITKIYVETDSLKEKLNHLGINNIEKILNFKNIEIIQEVNYSIERGTPYKLCMFSRVTELKGIENAIKTIAKINKKNNKLVYTIDIYGQIDKNFKEKFNTLLKDNSDYVFYKGIVDYDSTTNVLKNYFALLFPTQYYDEGVPGTIIDAFAAGLPVIASCWESANEIIENKYTGFLYEFNNFEKLENILIEVSSNPNEIISMKKNCIKEAEKYELTNALCNFFREITD